MVIQSSVNCQLPFGLSGKTLRVFLNTARSITLLSHLTSCQTFVAIIHFENIISPHAPLWLSEIPRFHNDD